MLGLGHEVFHADGAIFVRDRDLPDIWEANHVTGVGAASPDEIDRLLDRVEREYAGFGHRRFDVDVTTPPAFEARLLLNGYGGREFLVMLLAGEVRTGAPVADIRECTGLEAWTTYERLALEDWRESARRRGVPVDDGVGVGLARSHRRRSPPARGWLASADGAPRGSSSPGKAWTAWARWRTSSSTPPPAAGAWPAALIAHGSPRVGAPAPAPSYRSPTRRTRRSRPTRAWVSARWPSCAVVRQLRSTR